MGTPDNGIQVVIAAVQHGSGAHYIVSGTVRPAADFMRVTDLPYNALLRLSM
jgi:TolB-like protein